MTKVVCNICHHRCSLNKGQTGICRARKNIDGVGMYMKETAKNSHYIRKAI